MKDRMNIDEVFSHIGELGKQQLRYSLLLSILGMYGAQIMLQYTFVGHDMSFICKLENGSKLVDECPNGETSKCAEIIFDTSDTSSINSEWNLVCDRTWLSPLTMSLFMSGVMIGSLILGAVADAVGRKKTLSMAFLMLLIMNGGSAVATSFPLYICLKFASGFFMSGYILANFVLLNELIGASKRGLIGVATQAFFAGGIIAFSIMANYIRHWRQLTGASTAIAVPLIVLSHWILPESPRWLQNKGKIKEAIDVLKLIAFHNSSKWNDRLVNEDEESETDEDIEDFGEQRITINPNMRSSGQPQHNNDCTVNEDGLLLTDSVMDLFKHKFLTKLTLIQLYSWFVNGVSYYGLTLAAGSTNKRDLYMGTALSGAVEFPAYALSIFLLAYMGRTTTISAFMIIGGVSMLSIPICAPFLPFISTSLSLLGKLCISSSFAMIYIHSNEIFPTTIRNSGMGLVSVAARIGGIMAPYVSRLGNVFPNLHFILFGLLALTSGLCTIMLPDTKDQPLPETLNDLMSRRYRIVSVQSPNVSYKKVPSNEM